MKARQAQDSNQPAARDSGRRDCWQVQEARAALSQLLDAALAGRPQRITRRGRDVAVLISSAEYDRLVRPRESLVDFFRKSPLAEAVADGELDFERDRSPIRDVSV